MGTPRERPFLTQNPLFRRIPFAVMIKTTTREQHGFRS
jgi:hypothetical protein